MAIAQILAADTSGRNGDDAAVVPAPGGSVVITTDMSVDGVHIDTRVDPVARGYRAAARALSDIAAMGALPRAVVCAIAVPDAGWADVPQIVHGVNTRAAESGCCVVGGDLTRAAASGQCNAASISITCIGSPPATGPTLLGGARAGDLLVVTGWLGRACAGFHQLAQELPHVSPPSAIAQWFLVPPNRIDVGQALAPYVHAMTDISDGTVAEIRTMAAASHVHAALDIDHLPIDPTCAAALAAYGDPAELAVRWGDDYELLAAIPAHRIEDARRALAHFDIPLTIIGRCADGEGMTVLRMGAEVAGDFTGFAH